MRQHLDTCTHCLQYKTLYRHVYALALDPVQHEASGDSLVWY